MAGAVRAFADFNPVSLCADGIRALILAGGLSLVVVTHPETRTAWDDRTQLALGSREN